MKIIENITGTKPLKDFKHFFTPIDHPNQLNPIKEKGFYFLCGDYLKDHVYRDQVYFITDTGKLFYYSCFNEWKKSNNRKEHFINLLKLV